MQDVKKERYRYIGGSDIPIIMGLSHFKTRYDLLLEKAQLKDDDFEGNEFTEYGNAMEYKIRDYVNLVFHMNFQEDKLEHDDIRCHFDGIDKDVKMILEIKTTSQVYQNVNDYGVYLVQLLFYMMNANYEKGMLAVYHRPEDFDENFDENKLQLFTIDLNEYKDLCYEIMEEVEQFRIDLQKLKENPLMTEEDFVENSVVSLAHEVIKLEKQLQAYKELTKKYDDFKAKLKQAMEENDVKKWETPNGTLITLVKDTEDKEVSELYFDELKFALENQELHDKYMTSRKVVKKGKKGYVKITLKED